MIKSNELLPRERRKYSRHSVPKKAIAVSSVCICQIMEMSAGGCSLKFIDKDNSFTEETRIDIIYSSLNIFLNNIPIRIAWETGQNPAICSTLSLKMAGVQFGILSRHQKKVLTTFINEYNLA